MWPADIPVLYYRFADFSLIARDVLELQQGPSAPLWVVCLCIILCNTQRSSWYGCCSDINSLLAFVNACMCRQKQRKSVQGSIADISIFQIFNETVFTPRAGPLCSPEGGMFVHYIV